MSANKVDGAVASIVDSRKAKTGSSRPKRRNSKVLRADWWCLYKRIKLMKQSVGDSAVAEIVRDLDAIAQRVCKLQDARALAEAEKKDDGVVLWTVFFPRKYYWENTKFIERTPNCKINGTFSLADPIKSPVRSYCETDPWKDLDKTLHKEAA